MTGARTPIDPDGPSHSMTAAQMQRYGPPNVLELSTVPRPAPAAGEVLVEVGAAALNQHDAAVRGGKLKIVTGRKFPLGVGLDFAGTVVACGEDVHGPVVGEPVWGMVSPKKGHVSGAAAQFVVVPTDRVARSPARLTMVDAASLITTGTTAIRALRTIGQVAAGQRVLVRGAAGGVGAMAVQLAHAMGAHVTALAGPRDLALVSDLGADDALDYHTARPGDLDRFDCILDTTGRDLLAFRRRLRRGGRMITVAFGSGPALAAVAVSTVFGAARVRTFSSYPDRALLDELAEFVESGAIRPLVGAVYPLSRIVEAHQALEAPTVRGKIVLSMEPQAPAGPAQASSRAGR